MGRLSKLSPTPNRFDRFDFFDHFVHLHLVASEAMRNAARLICQLAMPSTNDSALQIAAIALEASLPAKKNTKHACCMAVKASWLASWLFLLSMCLSCVLLQTSQGLVPWSILLRNQKAKPNGRMEQMQYHCLRPIARVR